MQKGGVLFELLLIVAIIPCAVYCQGLAAAEADAVSSAPVVDPGADEIDQEAFKDANLLSSDEVARMIADADEIEERDGVVTDVNDADGRSLVARPIPIRCKDGPVRTIWRRPGYWYFPPIRVTRCRRLPCPNNSPCLARKTVTRDVWAICFKRFNCWGLVLWIPIGIQRLCVIDESKCECQECSDIKDYLTCVKTSPCPNDTNPNSFCYWKPCKKFVKADLDGIPTLSTSVSIDQIATSVVHPCLWGKCDCCRIHPCPHGQYFDKRTCMCRCLPSVICPRPFIVDPNTCRCICPRTNNCGPHMRWNPDTCRCECKRFFCFFPRIPNKSTCQCECPLILCAAPFFPDPASCQCKCPKDIICHPPKFLNQRNCRCECQPVLCAPGFVQDPDTCQCVCKRVCPLGSTLDPDTCKCFGFCAEIFNEDTCRKTDSCLLNRDHRCRWFPNYPRGPCQCDCCEKVHPSVSLDCGAITPFGEKRCIEANDPLSSIDPPCQWSC